MRTRLRSGPVALALAALSACEITRPFDLHPDAVAVAVLLVAGESEARLLAIHPHRREGAAPEITATLEGSGWTAAFTDAPGLETCTPERRWPAPLKCLRAELPEAILPTGLYSLRGTAPLGSFTGETVVPAVPFLVESADTLRLPLPDDPGEIGIPIRYQVGSEIGTLAAEILEIFETQEDGTERQLYPTSLGRFPQLLEGVEADTVTMRQRGKPLRFSLRLLGIGWSYTNFLRHWGSRDPVMRPWPSFGIRGEGVYGYFDGVTRSREVRVLVR